MQLTTLMFFCIIFLGTFWGLSVCSNGVIAAGRAFTWCECYSNKETFPLYPYRHHNWSKLALLWLSTLWRNTIEDVDNSGKSDNEEENERRYQNLKHTQCKKPIKIWNTHNATGRGHQQRPLGSTRGVAHTHIGGSLHDSTTWASKIYRHYL